MSGGHFDYKNDSLCSELFGWDVYAQYGIGTKPNYRGSIAQARKRNPMQDRLLSELVYDVLCLISSLDYWQSADISETQYRADAMAFKKKWLKAPAESIVNREIERTVDELHAMVDDFRETLNRDLLWERDIKG